jgi:hypothetical protein
MIKNNSDERALKKAILKRDKIKLNNKDNNGDRTKDSKNNYKENDHKFEKNKNDKLVKSSNDNIISKREGDIMANRVDDKNKDMDKNNDIGVDYVNKNKDKSKDIDINVDKNNNITRVKDEDIIVDADIKKNEICNNCTGGIEKILKELIKEKVDIAVTDSTMFLLNAVTILSVEEAIVKLKTTANTTIIIPIQEIVAIRSDLIYGISFQNNCEFEACRGEESLRRYFVSIIGRKVSIQTKGEGEFKYINSRIVTGTGKGIVIIEGTIAISLSKIILIEEIT